MRKLSEQQLTVLLATRCSYYAQSAEELAQNSETIEVQEALTTLTQKQILQAWEGYTSAGTLGIVYGYASNQNAQQIYYEIHRLPGKELL